MTLSTGEDQLTVTYSWTWEATGDGGSTLVQSPLLSVIPPLIFLKKNLNLKVGRTAVAQWLRCCATNRKVAGSIPDGVISIFY